MKSCLDCFFCKVTLARGMMRCKKGMWRKATDEEKFVVLKKQEKRKLDIGFRDVFNQAEKCSNFDEV